MRCVEIFMTLSIIRAEPDAPRRPRLGRHQGADRVEDNLELAVVFPLKGVDLALKVGL
jgi:hypothetical protein